MARPKGTHLVLTANLTDDGSAVYLRADRSWSPRLADAHPITDERERDELLSVARRQERVVCDPYTFGVKLGPQGRPYSLSQRESIRGVGPTCPQRRPDPQAHRKSA